MSHAAFLARHARTIRSVAAGLTVVAAGLTLTACGDNDGTGAKSSGKADSSVTAPADQGGADAGARGESGTGGTESGGTGGNGTGGTGGAKDTAEQAGKASQQNGGAAQQNGGGAASDGEREIGTCDVNKAMVTVDSVKRPINHLLLKFTNRAGVDCEVPSFPILRFDDAQAATPAAGETTPQSVITLAPGESAYAGITTSRGDDPDAGGADMSQLGVSLEGLDAETTLDLPGGSVYVDNTAQVTYWQNSASDALTW
ncbi:DUF4232 domain-containing protein [Streptomyces sp. NPDC059850]|uniref:DUF4232 domain-containing protein n=1 Tax=Streptomyces sp. NPDC059850 TaxID=3346970 RepID=UPI003656F567